MPENKPLTIINPATDETIEEIGTTTREELDAVAEKARQGFEEWREYAGLDRAEVFHDIARNLRDHQDELAEIMTREGGKPFIENHDEVDWTAACFDYYGEIARDSIGYLPAPIEPQQLALVIKGAHREPSPASSPGTTRSCSPPGKSPRPSPPATP